MADLPTVAVTMGDPAGVGPEVVAGALADPAVHAACRPLVVGDRRVMAAAARLMGTGAAVVDPSGPSGPGTLRVLDMANADPAAVPAGQVSAAAGAAAWDYIRKAAGMALAGQVQAVATAPIHKEAVRLAGVPFPGHTEMFAHLAGVRSYAMMLVDGGLRVAHVSTHVALREACALIRRERVLEVIRLLDGALHRLGIAAPRIAVAGLNPHCGEGGLFGDEEQEIAPAVQAARALGLGAAGPIPPDTVFPLALGGAYDGVVAMYHDQGHIAAKLQGFRFDARGRLVAVSGVNVTLGLPFVRTSVEHGTAFDLAGRGLANPDSMKQAILLGAALAGGGVGPG